jgi:hypothetical protein
LGPWEGFEVVRTCIYKPSQAFSADGENRISEEASYGSRGLEEACVDCINGVPSGEMLRVVAYEFRYISC